MARGAGVGRVLVVVLLALVVTDVVARPGRAAAVGADQQQRRGRHRHSRQLEADEAGAEAATATPAEDAAGKDGGKPAAPAGPAVGLLGKLEGVALAADSKDAKAGGDGEEEEEKKKVATKKESGFGKLHSRDGTMFGLFYKSPDICDNLAFDLKTMVQFLQVEVEGLRAIPTEELKDQIVDIMYSVEKMASLTTKNGTFHLDRFEPDRKQPLYMMLFKSLVKTGMVAFTSITSLVIVTGTAKAGQTHECDEKYGFFELLNDITALGGTGKKGSLDPDNPQARCTFGGRYIFGLTLGFGLIVMTIGCMILQTTSTVVLDQDAVPVYRRPDFYTSITGLWLVIASVTAVWPLYFQTGRSTEEVKEVAENSAEVIMKVMSASSLVGLVFALFVVFMLGSPYMWFMRLENFMTEIHSGKLKQIQGMSQEPPSVYFEPEFIVESFVRAYPELLGPPNVTITSTMWRQATSIRDLINFSLRSQAPPAEMLPEMTEYAADLMVQAKEEPDSPEQIERRRLVEGMRRLQKGAIAIIRGDVSRSTVSVQSVSRNFEKIVELGMEAFMCRSGHLAARCEWGIMYTIGAEAGLTSLLLSLNTVISNIRSAHSVKNCYGLVLDDHLSYIALPPNGTYAAYKEACVDSETKMEKVELNGIKYNCHDKECSQVGIDGTCAVSCAFNKANAADWPSTLPPPPQSATIMCGLMGFEADASVRTLYRTCSSLPEVVALANANTVVGASSTSGAAANATDASNATAAKATLTGVGAETVPEVARAAQDGGGVEIVGLHPPKTPLQPPADRVLDSK